MSKTDQVIQVKGLSGCESFRLLSMFIDFKIVEKFDNSFDMIAFGGFGNRLNKWLLGVTVTTYLIVWWITVNECQGWDE